MDVVIMNCINTLSATNERHDDDAFNTSLHSVSMKVHWHHEKRGKGCRFVYYRRKKNCFSTCNRDRYF